jgi:transcriptional regulator with XRE-family HTH domain
MRAREGLIEARLRLGLSQERLAERVGVTRNTISDWERGVKMPYPIHVKRLCDIFGMNAEELGLSSSFQEEVSTLTVSRGSLEEILQQCHSGLITCRALGSDSGHGGIMAASQVSATYVPLLKAFLSSHQHHTVATLLSQVYQIQQGAAYHLAGTSQSLLYAQEAVHYARLSGDATELAVALHELASVYEWPLPSLPSRYRHQKALEYIEEAVHTVQMRPHSVPPHAQAWIYIGRAKFQALNGLKQEAYASIGKAHEVRQNGAEFPGIYFGTANLERQAAIAYSYLGEQPKAVATFLKTVDINDEWVKPTRAMPDRFHVSLLSETTYSSLRVPAAQKDKALSVRLWKASLAKALELCSTTYFDEARSLLCTMEGIWSDDAEIGDLRDLLVPW